EMEAAACRYFDRIDELGGMVTAIEQNFPQREIADASFRYQREVDTGQRKVVGVNAYTQDGDDDIPTLRIDPELERKQVGRVEAVKSGRDAAAVEASLTELKAAAATDRNLMPLFCDCARARATEGEMVAALQEVFGTYSEQPVF
ncbi:MAG: methylmalonyl-CoA mutase family protein, partial [bacterium]